MTAYDETVERRARALAKRYYLRRGSWEGLTEDQQIHWRRLARATLEADDAAGYALVNLRCDGATLLAMAMAARKEHLRMVEDGEADNDSPDWANCVLTAIDEIAIRKE